VGTWKEFKKPERKEFMTQVEMKKTPGSAEKGLVSEILGNFKVSKPRGREIQEKASPDPV